MYLDAKAPLLFSRAHNLQPSFQYIADTSTQWHPAIYMNKHTYTP